MYGEGANAIWRHLPTGKNGLAASEGMHLDVVAEMFGINSGDELVRRLQKPEPQPAALMRDDASPKKRPTAVSRFNYLGLSLNK